MTLELALELSSNEPLEEEELDGLAVLLWIMQTVVSLPSAASSIDWKDLHMHLSLKACKYQHFGTTVLAYVNMVCASLRNSIPKSIVYCQVREAKRSLLDHFFTELGTKQFPTLQAKQLASLLDEDPAVMEHRSALAKRLELYRNAQAEIDQVAWDK